LHEQVQDYSLENSVSCICLCLAGLAATGCVLDEQAGCHAVSADQYSISNAADADQRR